jgi:hypothetical protein
MTKTQLANKLNVTTHTIKNWEESKPELIKLINLGLHAEEIILENDRLNKKLKKLFVELQSNKLQLPKNEINKEEFLNYRNPTDFDTVRVQKICNFLANVHIIDFRKILLDVLKKVELDDSGTYKYIQAQKNKLNIFKEFSKFIREMKSDNKIVETKRSQIVQYVNDIFKMDFNDKDVDTIDHIVIMYDYYSQLFGIEDILTDTEF